MKRLLLFGCAACSAVVLACSGGSQAPNAPSRPSPGASGLVITSVPSASAFGASMVDFARCLQGAADEACLSGARFSIRAVTGAAATIPGSPLNLTTASSGSTVTLTWGAPGSGDAVTTYLIEAGSAPGLANLANFATGSTAMSFSASGIGNGTYYVRVRAQNAAGTSAASNESILIVGSSACTSAPNAPGGLTGTVNGTTVTLTWGAPAGACAPTSYILRAGSSAGLGDFGTANVGAATSYVATVGEGDYYVQVRARNAYGESAGSNEILLLVGGTPSRWVGLSPDGMTVQLNPQDQCPVEYDLQLDLVSRGTKLTGTATTRLRKVVGVRCGDVLGEVATWPVINGTVGSGTIRFDFGNIGSHRFSGTLTATRMTGTFVITQTVPGPSTETGSFAVNRQ